MRVYVAGPYTKGDVALNVREIIEVAEKLIEMGHTPFVPHLTHLWHLMSPHHHEYWMELDTVWLEQCEALVRVPGDSTGADRELAHAADLGLGIYFYPNLPEA